MKIIYSGRPAELLPKERTKLEGKLAKVTKIVERSRGEQEIHVILSQERHLHHVEITMNVYDHAMLGVGSDVDLVVAMSSAIEKLEKQILKLRAKRRDTRRHESAATASEPVEVAPVKAKTVRPKAVKAAPVRPELRPNPKVFRVDHHDGRKPMTLEEAMLEMTEGHEYLVYRDANTNRLCTLFRRGDGHLDLIES
jgi:putative sigma-54 modulation protein